MKRKISRAECIVGIIVLVLLMIVFVTVPEYIAVYTKTSRIPIFNMELYKDWIPLVLVSFLLGIGKEIVKLTERFYTMKLAVTMTILDIISGALAIAVLSQPIWNVEAMDGLDSVIHFNGSEALEFIYREAEHGLIALVLLCLTIDLIVLWYRTFRNLSESIPEEHIG